VFKPGSFLMDHLVQQQLLLDRLTYFSFVTIAGLGYGDVVPGNAIGERFAILLSVSSTLYVALLVGLLLGRFIASQEVLMIEDDGLILESRESRDQANRSGCDPHGGQARSSLGQEPK